MAQRFGGKFSPGASGESEGGALKGRVPARMGARVNLLFVAPFLIAVSAFGQDPVGLALHLAGFALMMLAAWLTREGLRAEDAYNARKVARRPAIPRKLFGSALIGGGLALAGISTDGGVLAPVIFGLLGAVLHAFAFGPDPMTDKTTDEIDLFQSDRVARVVDEAEQHLEDMRTAIAKLGDRHLNDRVARFAATAQDMARTVEDDPRDLTGARKYLGVYLQGARDASQKFAELYSRRADPAARKDFETLLDDLEKSFAARTAKMLLDDKSDLTVEIDVLRERLEREGVRAE